MKSAGDTLPTGTRIRTHAVLGTTTGMMVASQHLTARQPDTLGTINGIAGGHGGEVYFVAHEGTVGAYCWDEFELAEPIEACEAQAPTRFEKATSAALSAGILPGDIVAAVGAIAREHVSAAVKLGVDPYRAEAIVYELVIATAEAARTRTG